MDTSINTQDLKKKIDGYLETLMLETDEARRSEAMQKYLLFASKFHKYSPSNVLLIMLTKPNATNVAGFQTWKKMNRFVKKGERGIPIFAPMVYKENPDKEDSPKVLSGFRIVYVFDVSQTAGNPLPPIPDWKSPEKNEELKTKLIAFAMNNGIEVVFKDLPGEVQGVSKGGLIEIDSSAGTKTMIHELAHELLGHHQDFALTDKSVRELQAESVSYVVAKYFGIDELQSSNYLALHGVSQKSMIREFDVIQKCASSIIVALEDGLFLHRDF